MLVLKGPTHNSFGGAGYSLRTPRWLLSPDYLDDAFTTESPPPDGWIAHFGDVIFMARYSTRGDESGAASGIAYIDSEHGIIIHSVAGSGGVPDRQDLRNAAAFIAFACGICAVSVETG